MYKYVCVCACEQIMLENFKCCLYEIEIEKILYDVYNINMKGQLQSEIVNDKKLKVLCEGECESESRCDSIPRRDA